ncbi:MAG: LUD domain-containing protein [Caldilineaceae bacterium]
MSTARERVLARIQTALNHTPAAGEPTTELPPPSPVARNYRQRDEAPRAAIIDRFIERVTEYKAHVQRINEGELGATIAATLARRHVERLVVPADLPAAWLPTDLTLLRDGGDLSYEMLDGSHGVLTGCILGIAQTGTIVLDHGPLQGRRAISLVPDYHLCVVRADQIVGVMPEAIAQLSTAVQARRPITFVSGPSATSDIELNRVEGVHGPRTLDVLVVI